MMTPAGSDGAFEIVILPMVAISVALVSVSGLSPGLLPIVLLITCIGSLAELPPGLSPTIPAGTLVVILPGSSPRPLPGFSGRLVRGSPPCPSLAKLRECGRD
jgi:hypothetical protein